MLLILVALVSPLAALDDQLVWVHMAQHLVLGDLAALLIVLGLTGPLLQPLLATRGLGWLRVLGHPAVALPLWLADLYLWHVPALYEAALSSQAVHALEHACFVGFGIAMWMALLGPLPKPDWFGNGARLIYVIVVRFGGAVLANVLLWSGSALYPDYAAGEAAHGISPLADQGAAGVVMMIEQGLVTLGLFAWLFFRAARAERRAPGAARPGGWREACRSTRPGPRGRWRPGRETGSASGSRPHPLAPRGERGTELGLSGSTPRLARDGAGWPPRCLLRSTSARPCCAARALSSAVDEDLGHRARRLPRPRRGGDRGRRRRAPCGARRAPARPATCACPAFARARCRRNSSSSGLGATPSSSRRSATRCPSGTSARSWTRGSPPSATRSWTCPRSRTPARSSPSRSRSRCGRRPRSASTGGSRSAGPRSRSPTTPCRPSSIGCARGSPASTRWIAPRPRATWW